jgi:hypothetical protein
MEAFGTNSNMIALQENPTLGRQETTSMISTEKASHLNMNQPSNHQMKNQPYQDLNRLIPPTTTSPLNATHLQLIQISA